eukprot:c11533_g1_i1 orf=486-1367(-)
MLVAFWFTMLPEWTTWMLLVAMALYDLVAVLAPGGPLNLLLELAISRDEEIPALIYEARPVTRSTHASSRATLTDGPASVEGQDNGRPRRWRSHNRRTSTRDTVQPSTELQPRNMTINGNARTTDSIDLERQSGRAFSEGGHEDTSEQSSLHAQDAGSEDELLPLVSHVSLPSGLTASRSEVQSDHHHEDVSGDDDEWGLGLSSSGALKLGLGDFVFYSLLVGRAAMYDLTTVYACYLAIIAGLGSTLVLLAVARRALPALPISIGLGVIFYFLTRLLMEPLVAGLSTTLIMF